ncbi:hypothetical protein NQ317_011366 [Molorchus minor]|uniref:leucine--tRNA ligase n=1 Tax=Molorchus minor TaxID=1323400 RepID=A0ABQ9JCJ6_9CUCU|nr:hypothetical protein NQ317_011366 [Molorchus minor]
MSDSYVGIPDIDEQAMVFAKKYNISYNPVPRLASKKQIEDQQQNLCNKAQQLSIGGYWTSVKLRDWLISRQRYWGTPIPIIHCGKVWCPACSERESSSDLTKAVKTCSKRSCKGETDTMDTFVDSSWYYLRYLDPTNNKEMFDKEKAMKLMPVDLYIGGKEHGIHLQKSPNAVALRQLHLSSWLYGPTRVFPHYQSSAFNELKNTANSSIKHEEELLVFLSTHAACWVFSLKGVEVFPHDLKRNKAVAKETGNPVVISWEKMSKSKYNGVDPDEMFKTYGVDTTRLLILADVARHHIEIGIQTVSFYTDFYF